MATKKKPSPKQAAAFKKPSAPKGAVRPGEPIAKKPSTAAPSPNKPKGKTMGTKTAAKSSVSRVRHSYTRSQRGLE